MLTNKRFIISFITFLIIHLQINTAVLATDYLIKQYNKSSVKIQINIPDKSFKSKNSIKEILFALQTLPDITADIQLVHSNNFNNTAVSAKVLSRGWYGNKYLQWFSLTVNSLKSADTIKKASVQINFSNSIFSGDGSNKNIMITGDIIQIPLQKKLSKKLNYALTKPLFKHGLRIEILKNGIYKITGEALINSGVKINTIPKQKYRLFCQNEEIPLSFNNSAGVYLNENDFINFYGNKLLNNKGNEYYTQYSNTNIYWLTWDTGLPGLRFTNVSGAIQRESKNYIDPTDTVLGISATEFADTIHIEHDNTILRLSTQYDIPAPQDSVKNFDMDNWYWQIIGRNDLSSVKFVLPSPSSSQTLMARLRIKFMGLTSVSNTLEDHKYDIFINGENPGPLNSNQTASWDGQNPYIFESGLFPASKLINGINTLEMTVVPRDGIKKDLSALNWIEVEYVRNWNVFENELKFHNDKKNINALYQFSLTGFTTDTLELWDLKKFRKFYGFNVIPGTEDNTYNMIFQDSITSYTEYYALATSKQIEPDTMFLDTITLDWDFNVDYIMITSKDFIPILDTLKQVHEKYGLKVKIVSIESIYNRFSYGIQNPESIRDMLKYLFSKNQKNPPRFLLLAGDATHDLYKKYTTRKRTIVPTHLTTIPDWGTASDDGYFVTVLGNDNFPDLSVGRFPANTEDELTTMVNKTVNYIQNPNPGYWKDNMLMAGGFEPDFTEFNNDITESIINNKMNILRMDANYMSPYFQNENTASNTMAGYINSGVYFINFAGHGGGHIWSDSRFFSYDDLDKLHNSQWGLGGRLPVVFSFTCLTGFFESPDYKSLGEEFLRYSNDGAISFYGASGYSKKELDLNMDRILLETALYGNVSTVGELISNYEMKCLVKYGRMAIPATRQYNLLGDPALPWNVTEDTLKISLQNDILSGKDSLVISAKTYPIINGNVKIRVLSDADIWTQTIKNVSDTNFLLKIPLKENATTANGVVRAYVWNDSSEIKGLVPFCKNAVMIFDVQTNPVYPKLGDSIYVKCKLPIDSTNKKIILRCFYTVNNPQSKDINFNELPSVNMTFDTATGYWKTDKKITVGTPNQEFSNSDMLLIRFNAFGSEVGQSKIFKFKLEGRPDLAFTNDTLTTAWINDSLFIMCNILNKGNKKAPTYNLTLFWGDSSKSDTLYNTYSTDSLLPTKIHNYKIYLPDTQGVVKFTGVINNDNGIKEIISWDNTATGSISMVYSDIKTQNDSLVSINKDLIITPADTLKKNTRIYLFDNNILEKYPLKTQSLWHISSGNNAKSYTIKLRPKPDLSDSIKWLFIPNPNISGAPKIRVDSSYSFAIFIKDSVANNNWKNISNTITTNNDIISVTTTQKGPMALGKYTDKTPPQIQVFVGGKEIRFLDFAPKGKPFNISISDPSGIVASSISIKLNSEELDSASHSQIIQKDNTTMSITAYLKPSQTIDSLQITASDFAGNSADKIFAYYPGEELNIKFFSCHPNPFTAQYSYNGTKLIRFAFLLTDVADNATLSIYTMAGRKIWRWSESDIIGYKEVAWDGKTYSGYRIGNGTYYAKLVVKNKDKKIKKIIKIAKLEGF